MQEYELTVLIHPDRENELEKALDVVRSLVTTNGGKVVKEDNWGKKRLAYRVKKQDFAVYVLMDVELPAAAPLKISSALNISDDVIRYLLVKVDAKERARLAAAKNNQPDEETEEQYTKGIKEEYQGKRAAGPNEFTSFHRAMRKTVGLSYKPLGESTWHDQSTKSY